MYLALEHLGMAVKELVEVMGERVVWTPPHGAMTYKHTVRYEFYTMPNYIYFFVNLFEYFMSRQNLPLKLMFSWIYL